MILGTCIHNFVFRLFVGIFIFFCLYNTSIFILFQATVTVFHLWMWYLGWENLVLWKIEDFWICLKLQFFTTKWVIFPIFWAIFQYTFVTGWLRCSSALCLFFKVWRQKLEWTTEKGFIFNTGPYGDPPSPYLKKSKCWKLVL